MPLDSPRLDDRSFEDIVQEALRRIPLYTPEWTDHNLSDPGITLIELFAWMTDIILYRLNRVPDRHYIKLMELIGMKLREPEAATTRVTFWLSAPQPTDITIQQGTEIATTRTENDPAIVFSSNEPFTIQVARLGHILTSYRPDGGGEREYKEQNLRQAQAGFSGKGFAIFQEKPQPGDAVYFGFKNNLTHHILGLDVVVDRAAGAGIDPTNPPYIWEALASISPVEWARCEIDSDASRAFNVPGLIRLHLPKMVEGQIKDWRGYWVRCRLLKTREDEPQYQESPHFNRMNAASWGATIPATHASRIKTEVLGRSDGSPGQRFHLENTPVLERGPGEHVIVRLGEDNEEVWTEVADFASSSPDDRHYTIDNKTGEVRFGPAMPLRDGSIKRYGAIPPKGSLILMKQYRHGGGIEGNLQAGAINVLKTSIPYIDTVLNRFPATGGLDGEDVDHAKLRVPGYLRSLERAVTAKDFEYLAVRSAPGRVARAFALPVASEGSSRVNVFIIPQVNNPRRYIEQDELNLTDDVRQQVHDYLDERRLLTTRMEIMAPQYYWIQTRVRLKASDHADPENIEQLVQERLNTFINPIIGGFEEQGWPFGRDLMASDVIACLQSIPGIDFIRSVELFWIQRKAGGETEREGPLQVIETVTHGVIASYRHDIRVDHT